MDDERCILVEIDRDFMPVVPGYLENRCSECGLLADLLEAGRYDEITVIGHRIKGSGGSYGFDAISEIGEVLEKAAQNCDDTGIRSSIDCMKRYLSRVTVTYI